VPTTYDLLHFPDANGTTTFPNDNPSGDTWSACVTGAQNTDAYFGGFVASVFSGNTARQLGGGDSTTDGGIKASASKSHTGKFCHEFWYRSANVAFGGCLWSIGDNSSSSSLSLWQNTDGSLRLDNGTTTLGTSAAGTISNSTNYGLCVLRDGSNNIKVCVDGVVVLTVSLSGTISGVRAIDNCLTSGTYSSSHYAFRGDEYRGTDGDDRYTSFPYTLTTVEFVFDYGGGAIAGVSLRPDRGPRFLRQPLNKSILGFVASASTDTPVNPGVGALAFTGYAPTIAQPQAANPGAGALTLTGYAPTIAQPQAVSPGAGSLTLTGYAPSVVLNVNVAPAAGALTFTGYAPSIAQPQAVTPGVGAITFTGFAPSVSQGQSANPSVGAITITGYAPSIAQPQSASPGVGTMAITGYAPAISQPQAVAPGAGSITFTGYAPSVAQTANQSVAPGAGALALAGFAPTIAQTANQSVLPGVGVVTLSGFAPTVTVASASVSLVPGTGALILTGYAPDVSQSGATAGSGGAPLDYFPLQISAKERKRRLRAARWAAEEERITAALMAKPVPAKVATLPLVVDVPRLEVVPIIPAAPTVDKAAIAEAVEEALRTKARAVATEAIESARAHAAAQQAASQAVDAEMQLAAAVESERIRLHAEAMDAEMQMAHAVAEEQARVRKRRNEQEAIAHALLLMLA
jgi:hypothetical protein